MDLSGNQAKDGVAESPDTQLGKTETSSLSAADGHSLSGADEDSALLTEDDLVSSPDESGVLSEENGDSPPVESSVPFTGESASPDDNTFATDEEELSAGSPEDGDGLSCSPEEIFALIDCISELPKETSFEKALKKVQIPEIVYGEPFQRFIRLFTDNNSFKSSVCLTGEPAANDPGVSIVTNPDGEYLGDCVFLSGMVNQPGILEITIPYAILDPRLKEPVEKEGILSVNIVDPLFSADVNRAYQENNNKPDGLEKSKRLPRWGREGSKYEGECDISEFISLCNGEIKLEKCILLDIDSMEPAAGMKASVDYEKGKLKITGTPACHGAIMLRFLYPKGQQSNLTDRDDLIEIVPSSFFKRMEEIIETLQKMSPKQAMAGNSVKLEIPLPVLFDPDSMSITDLAPSDSHVSAVYKDEKKVLEITGTPGGSGAIALMFNLVAKTELGHEITKAVKMPLFELCSDTKSMWKNLPTDSSAPYQAQDEDHAIVEAGTRTILAASKRGRTHAHHGKFRDDNFKACYIQETGWIVVAVSDGAGSAQYSREGSRIICDTFCETLRKKLSSGEFGETESAELEDKVKASILDAAHQGLSLIEAETRNMAQTNTDVTVKDYSATLLGYVMKQFEDGWLIVSIGIGDGVIGLLDKSDQLILLSCPDHGEYSGQTRFLTTSDVWSDNPMSRTAAVRIKDFKAIFSMSDGVSDPKFETENEMKDPQFWVSLWNEISSQVPLEERSEQTATRLSEWLDFVSRGYNDDRTIVLVY